MPEEWPDFSKKKVDPDIGYKFFNRKYEFDVIMRSLQGRPSEALVLLGPLGTGKSVSKVIVN